MVAQIARMLAQPELEVATQRRGGNQDETITLPRARVMIIGGDLAYVPSEVVGDGDVATHSHGSAYDQVPCSVHGVVPNAAVQRV